MWYPQRVGKYFVLFVFNFISKNFGNLFIFKKKYSSLADLKYFCNSTKTSSVLNKKMSLKIIFFLPLLYLFPTDSKSVDNYLIKKNDMKHYKSKSNRRLGG